MSRIVVLTDSLGSHAGGLAHATLNLAIASAESLPADELFVVAQSDRSEIDIGKCIPDNLSIIKYSGFRNRFFPYSFHADNLLCSLDPDVLHLRGLWRQSSLIAVDWKRTYPSHRLIVQTAGMLEPWAWKRNSVTKKLYFRFFESDVLALADHIHATSNSEKENLLEFGLPASKIFVVEEGIHLPLIKSPKFCAESVPEKSKVLLFLARLHPVKGIDILLEALALLRPRDWQCKIAGMGHPRYVNHLHHLVDMYKLRDIVSFSGPLSGNAKAQAFSEATAYILPSYSESFGISIAEAMSWQLPVITTTTTPWSDIPACQMGWYVPPNINSISKALYELFTTSDSDLKLLGENARDYVKDRYSWPQLGKKISSFYVS